MSQILLQADEARTAADDVTASATQVQGDFDSLKSRLGGLADSFQGRSADAFDNKYTEWETSAKELLEALDSLGKFLTSAANTIEETDSSIAGNLA